MKLQTFRADSMSSALVLVKRGLGPDALIVNTRTVRERQFWGLAGRKIVEITATGEKSPLRRSDNMPIIGPQRTQNASGTEGAVIGMKQVEWPALRDLHAEVRDLRYLMGDVLAETRRSRPTGMPEPLRLAFEGLVANQVAEDLALQLIEDVKSRLSEAQWSDAAQMRAALTSRVAALVPTGGPVIPSRKSASPCVVVMIGPTGVGKTTTIAKLAAQHGVRDGQRVGLITIDTQRIGAVDQLRKYADLLDIPLEVARSPDELAACVQAFGDRDLILIDTAGRNPNDAARLAELKRYLAQVRADEVHLVLSTTGDEATLVRAAERFCELGVDRILFTKLDEALGFGVMLNVLDRVQRKVSYLTNGQSVPDDIEAGRSDSLADLIVPSGTFAASA